jgi:hypothetical protein
MGKQFIQKAFNSMKSSTWSEIIKHNELQNTIINHINRNSDICCTTNELGYSFANCPAESSNSLTNCLNAVSNNYTNSCHSIRPNAVSVGELENLTKKVDELELDLNKKIETMGEEMNKEINEKLNWQAICLYLTWAMLIVLGFMICFKSFDVSIEVNNPIQNQEVILEHE